MLGDVLSTGDTSERPVKIPPLKQLIGHGETEEASSKSDVALARELSLLERRSHEPRLQF